MKTGNDYLTEQLKSIKKGASGRGPVWFRVPEWGSGGRRFESGRPDHHNFENK